MGFIDEVRANAREMDDIAAESELRFRETVIENFKKAVVASAHAGVTHGFVSGMVSLRRLAPGTLTRDFYNYGYKEAEGCRRQRIGMSESAIRIARIVLEFAKQEEIYAKVCLHDPIGHRRWELNSEELARITLKLRGQDQPVTVADSRITIRFECQL